MSQRRQATTIISQRKQAAALAATTASAAPTTPSATVATVATVATILPPARSTPRSQLGFTLIEMVVTLMVSAIMAVGVISYIGDSIDGFGASSQRSRLAAAGRIAVDRIAMEVYNAVPNSLRTDGQCLEFLPAVAATSYIDPPFWTGSNSVASAHFQAVRPTEGSGAGAAFAVIFPIDSASVYSEASPRGPVAAIESIDEGLVAEGRVTVELAQPHQFEGRSPLNRLYLAAEPVSFCVDDGRLFRYQNYGMHQDQCTPITCLPSQLPDRMLVSGPLDNAGLQAFRVDSPTLRRNALVTMNLNFADRGDVVNMRHEVMSRNVP